MERFSVSQLPGDSFTALPLWVCCGLVYRSLFGDYRSRCKNLEDGGGRQTLQAAERFVFAFCCSYSCLLPGTGANGTAQPSSSTPARRKGADQQLPGMATCDSLSGSRTTFGIFLQPGIWPCLEYGPVFTEESMHV